MLVVGVMSGTSLDGVDAAIARIRDATHVDLVGFAHRPYSAAERAAIESVLRGASIADVARLHTDLSHWAADAIDVALELSHVKPDRLAAIAMHGQTVWHQPPRVSMQLGEPAVLAERFGVRVVHNFRARDVAAGGEGAPLVPIADALCFGAADHPRILLNIGGMANVTWVRRRGDIDHVIAGDTGPGVALIDAIARTLDPDHPYDVDGALARSGTVNEPLLAELLADPFFARPMPRSTGRELFGAGRAAAILSRAPGADGLRTAVELTVRTIVDCCARLPPRAPEVVVSGGGIRNHLIADLLATGLAAHGMALRRFDELFFSGDAKEAAAFALLGWLAIHGQPGNIPAATGAAGARVLGSITPA